MQNQPVQETNEQGQELPAPPQPRERKQPSRPKALIFLFSLVPGAGHMYLGLMTRGSQLMGVFFGSLFVMSLVGHPLDQLWSMLIAPVVWFYSFFDALQISGKLERGEEVTDESIPFVHVPDVKWGKTAGWVLIGLGVLALLNNLGFVMPHLSMWVRRLVGPVLLVAVGLWLLFREGKEA